MYAYIFVHIFLYPYLYRYIYPYIYIYSTDQRGGVGVCRTIAKFCGHESFQRFQPHQSVAAPLQCVVVCCSVLQCVAVCYSVL